MTRTHFSTPANSNHLGICFLTIAKNETNHNLLYNSSRKYFVGIWRLSHGYFSNHTAITANFITQSRFRYGCFIADRLVLCQIWQFALQSDAFCLHYSSACPHYHVGYFDRQIIPGFIAGFGRRVIHCPFRTAIKDPEELIFLFFAIAVGLGFGADQRIPTLVASAIILALLLAPGILL